MEEFYKKGKIVRGVIDPEIASAIVHWNYFSNDEVVYECTRAQVDAVRNKGARVIIVDVTVASGMLSETVQAYFQDEFYPNLEDAKVLACITITPRRELTLAAAEQWIKLGGPFSFGMYEAASLEAARELAAKLVAEERG